MNTYSAQGSITIKRLRTGNQIYITFDSNGKALYQGIDTESGVVSPDFTNVDNQPTRTPKVTSIKGLASTLSNHTWKYNGMLLSFSGSETWQTDSTGKFQMKPSDGTIKIIGNLASTTNIAADTLTWSAICATDGYEETITKDLTVNVQNVGSSAYVGIVSATTEQLTSDVPTITLSTKLYLGITGEVPSYYVKWYKDSELISGQNSATLSVTRDMVDGTQLFIAEFYKSSAETVYISRAAIRITDVLDEYQINLYVSSDNKEVDTNKAVTVTAYIIK